MAFQLYTYVDASVDTHVHLRNSIADGDGRMEMNMGHLLGQHQTILHIGNGNPAMLDLPSVELELEKASRCIPYGVNLDIRGTPLLTDHTSPETIIQTRIDPMRRVVNWKMFFDKVSNDGGNSVSDIRIVQPAIRALYDPAILRPALVLDIHAERKFDRNGKRIEMRDREWYAIVTDVSDLIKANPDLTVVIKHISDFRTLLKIIEWRRQGYKVFAEICPQYLFRCHEDLYEGPGGIGTAFNAHDLCWPLYKDERSRKALLKLVLSGADWILFGSDWACHAHDPIQIKGVKIDYEGIIVGGVTILPAVAKSLLIDLFLAHSTIEALNKYMSGNARRVYRLPPCGEKIRYMNKPWVVPMEIHGQGPEGRKIVAKPFMRGEVMNHQLAA